MTKVTPCERRVSRNAVVLVYIAIAMSHALREACE